eukprot:6188251-Pleurochrysis_carterae.AAC.3
MNLGNSSPFVGRLEFRVCLTQPLSRSECNRHYLHCSHLSELFAGLVEAGLDPTTPAVAVQV